jgi:hypothetical protein
MKEFTLDGFAKHLDGLVAGMPALELAMLETIGVTVENAAKDKIGDYQAEAGPFEAWAPLTEGTQDERERKGYAPDEPLLRTGELRASITHRVEPPVVEIGSDDPIAEYQELGTKNIPPRSFLGGAAFEQAPKLTAELGKEMELYLAGLTETK